MKKIMVNIMENAFFDSLKRTTNFKQTENGGIAHKTTNSNVYDMFALGGAYRERSNNDCILLFKNALEENEILALKCLFYLRDCRGGQGERRFFRVCYTWLCKEHPEIAKRNLVYISEFGRWDDIVYIAADTNLQDYAFDIIKEQLLLDIDSNTPSLLGKWLPSENASSKKTKHLGNAFRKFMGYSHKEYRKVLSMLRQRINIVERLMSENRWEEIKFDKIPSKAGLIYKNAFARRDIIAARYEAFMKNKTTKVNASTLYPYEIVSKAINSLYDDDEIQNTVLEKYWENLPNYLEGDNSNTLCVIDTSGSMSGMPINVAISLGMYFAERNHGAFKDYYISFASRPQLIKIEGIDFVDKVSRIYRTNLCDNTNLDAVFDLLKQTALSSSQAKADLPKRIIIISDMEIDEATERYYWLDDEDRNPNMRVWKQETTATNMEEIRKDWAAAGLELPELVYWNVNARDNNILDSGDSVSFVSGASPIIYESILKGVKGIDIMYDKLNSTRYEIIK